MYYRIFGNRVAYRQTLAVGKHVFAPYPIRGSHVYVCRDLYGGLWRYDRVRDVAGKEAQMAGLKSLLTSKDFRKLAKETGVTAFQLEKMYAMGLLRTARITDLLIRYDYKEIMRSGRYTREQVVMRLMAYYQAGQSKINDAIKDRYSKYHYCDACGKIIDKRTFIRNEGLCDECKSKTIEIPD